MVNNRRYLWTFQGLGLREPHSTAKRLSICFYKLYSLTSSQADSITDSTKCENTSRELISSEYEYIGFLHSIIVLIFDKEVEIHNNLFIYIFICNR